MTTTEQSTAEEVQAIGGSDPGGSGRPGLRQVLAFRNMGVVYVWAGIIVLFSFWAPDTFPTWQTVQSVLNQNAIAGLVALALVVPLSAGVFDLSVGSALGLCNVIVAWLLVDQGLPIAAAIAITVAVGLVIGLANGLVVVGGRIDSFIATLATGSLMAAATSLISNDQAIIGPGVGGAFADISTSGIGGIGMPVFLMLAVATALWFLLNFTVTGRRIYATGFNQTGARLTGIATRRLGFASLVVSGGVAGVGGVLLASQVSSGSPDIGPPYLLDAFAAAFLGATQFGGRFNAWGTVVAVLLLGTGKAGLILVGAPVWAPATFTGAVLLFALLLTNYDGGLNVRRWLGRGSADGALTPAGEQG